ncbi:hypothetical protein HK100_006685 [Physocladia obscura]|uniref:Uncharacterized protein n=1 Tax=Physocladia obscura TaxID=109957 RepID=A0AAD5SQ52_9FUNG|nr:hypothetical protein HK100_006685 [Physocladia obscura]
MGLEQSKIIKRQLLQPSRSASNSPEYQQREDRAKSASMKPQTPIPSMPRISPTKPTRPISSTGKLIPAARIDAVLAKVWNPNNPDSWDAPMREYHNADDSDYIMPSDEIEQTRLEAQHYIYRVGFQG